MRSILKRLINLVARLVILVTLFRYASTYFFSKKAAMTLAPVVALSHGGGEIIPPLIHYLLIHHPLPFSQQLCSVSITLD